MEKNGNSMSATRKCIMALFCGRINLFLLMTGYTILGAILFKTIEKVDNQNAPVDFQNNREECLKELWLITERLNVLYEKNWTKLVTNQLKRFEKAVVESNKVPDLSNAKILHWNFAEALLYSITLLTTIGYEKLTPKTAFGKVVTMIYAIIGIPLMLVLLSTFGSIMASRAKKSYFKLCCQTKKTIVKSPSTSYHKSPSTTSRKHFCESLEGSVLATVRSSHIRGKQGLIRQTIADGAVPICSTHNSDRLQIMKNSANSSIVGITVSTDLEEADDTDDNDQIVCTHDTPSRTPLIWRPSDIDNTCLRSKKPSPTVPTHFVIVIFIAYVCLGAFAFSLTSNRSFLDALYICFIALTTIGIGIGEGLPQMHILACCVYIFVGLVIIAMCIALVQAEITFKCRQISHNFDSLFGNNKN